MKLGHQSSSWGSGMRPHGMLLTFGILIASILASGEVELIGMWQRKIAGVLVTVCDCDTLKAHSHDQNRTPD